MSDVPIHPMVVHFPIVLALLSPVVIGGALYLVAKKGSDATRTWLVVVVYQAALFVSALVTMRLGEGDEERVEKVVAESFIENHEEWAEIFTWSIGATLALAAVTLFVKKPAWLKTMPLLAAVLTLAPMAGTGHSGGELVYKHGAASAYVSASKGGSASAGGEKAVEWLERETDEGKDND